MAKPSLRGGLHAVTMCRRSGQSEVLSVRAICHRWPRFTHTPLPSSLGSATGPQQPSVRCGRHSKRLLVAAVVSDGPTRGLATMWVWRVGTRRRTSVEMPGFLLHGHPSASRRDACSPGLCGGPTRVTAHVSLDQHHLLQGFASLSYKRQRERERNLVQNVILKKSHHKVKPVQVPAPLFLFVVAPFSWQVCARERQEGLCRGHARQRPVTATGGKGLPKPLGPSSAFHPQMEGERGHKELT